MLSGATFNIEIMEATPMAAGLEPGPSNPQPFSAGLHVQPSFDVIALLPERAADRLRALRQRFHDTNKLIPRFEELREANTAKVEAEQRLKRLLDHQSVGGFHLPQTDPRVIEQQRLLDKLTNDARRLKELQEVRSAAWHAASHVLTAVEGWLKDGKPPVWCWRITKSRCRSLQRARASPMPSNACADAVASCGLT
jgi:hypothetical protein